MARRKPRKPERRPADQVTVETKPRASANGARAGRALVVAKGSYGLTTLVQCLHRYIEANPSRFTAREDGPDRLRIVTVVLAQVTDQT